MYADHYNILTDIKKSNNIKLESWQTWSPMSIATSMHAVCVYIRIMTIIFELKVWGLNSLAQKTSQIQSFYLSIVLFPSVSWKYEADYKIKNGLVVCHDNWSVLHRHQSLSNKIKGGDF